MTTKTVVSVEEAESRVRNLLANGSNGQELAEAEDQLWKARQAVGRAAAQSQERERMRGELQREAAVQRKQEDKQRADAAERLFTQHEVPTVEIKFAGVSVRIKLLGGRDAITRQTSEEAVRRTVHTIGQMFLDALGPVRLTGDDKHVPLASDLIDTDKLRATLAWELKAADRLGAVSIR